MGTWITVQCPREFDTLMMEAGGVWEPGERRWLLRLHRLGPVLRALRREADPLFRHQGINLDADRRAGQAKVRAEGWQDLVAVNRSMICVECGATAQARRRTRRFCSDWCRQTACRRKAARSQTIPG
jgi:hypothetical protein